MHGLLIEADTSFVARIPFRTMGPSWRHATQRCVDHSEQCANARPSGDGDAHVRPRTRTRAARAACKFLHVWDVVNDAYPVKIAVQ